VRRNASQVNQAEVDGLPKGLALPLHLRLSQWVEINRFLFNPVQELQHEQGVGTWYIPYGKEIWEHALPPPHPRKSAITVSLL